MEGYFSISNLLTFFEGIWVLGFPHFSLVSFLFGRSFQNWIIIIHEIVVQWPEKNYEPYNRNKPKSKGIVSTRFLNCIFVFLCSMLVKEPVWFESFLKWLEPKKLV